MNVKEYEYEYVRMQEFGDLILIQLSCKLGAHSNFSIRFMHQFLLR